MSGMRAARGQHRCGTTIKAERLQTETAASCWKAKNVLGAQEQISGRRWSNYMMLLNRSFNIMFAPIRPNSGQIWSSSAQTWPFPSQVCWRLAELEPNLVDIGPSVEPNLCQSWSMTVQLRRNWSISSQCSPSSGQSWPNSGPNWSQSKSAECGPSLVGIKRYLVDFDRVLDVSGPSLLDPGQILVEFGGPRVDSQAVFSQHWSNSDRH